jgi:hypothetical protein
MSQPVTSASVLRIALPSATLAVSVTGGGIIREWDAYKGTAERRLALGDQRVVQLAISPDARYVVCATDAGYLLVYDGRAGNLLRAIGPAAAPVRALAAAPDSGLVIAAFGDQVLRCYDPRSGDLRSAVAAGSSPVQAVAVSGHGREAIAACADGVLRRWDLVTGTLIGEAGAPGPARATAMTMTGIFAVTGRDDGTIWRWNLPNGTFERTAAAGRAGIRAIAATPGGDLVLVLTDDGDISLRQMSDGAVLTDLTAPLGAVPPAAPAVAPSPPPAPPVLDQDVQFTVYRPAALPAADRASMLVFAHKTDLVMDPVSGPVDPVEEVRARARAHFGRVRTRTNQVDAEAPLIRGGQISIVPELPGIRCDPAAADLVWRQPVHQVEFQLYAGPELGGSVVRGWVRIWCGPLIIGQLPIALPVAPVGTDPAAVPAGLTGESVLRHRRIFPSYSHRDAHMVEPFVVAARVIGDKYLQEVLELCSGDEWQEGVLELIDSADAFQLFWSTNSMRSEYCRREWEYALALPRQHFVYPVYWEDPLPRAPELGLPSEELNRLHFARIPAAASPPGGPASYPPADLPPPASEPSRGAHTGQMAAVAVETRGPPQLLVVSPGTMRGQRVYVARGEFMVGRAAENDLVLDDPHVSRVHAVLRRQGDELYLQDLGSTAGTTVNGIPVTGPQRLYPGDVVGFAQVQLRYEDADIGRGQPAPVTSGVGRDAYASPPSYGPPQSWPGSYAPSARKTRAWTLVVPGIVLAVLGFAVYGAAASPLGMIGLAAGLLGSVLLIAGIVRYAAARRRGADRRM